MSDGVARQVGTAFALSAFAVAIVSGLCSGAGASTTLPRSLVVLVAASAIGRVLGAVIEACLNEHLTRTLAANPVAQPMSLRPVRDGAGVEAEAHQTEQRP